MPRAAATSPFISSSHNQRLRPPRSAPRAFVRMEPAPGERFEIDWGHFGMLNYQGDLRKLYAFCLIEAHSRRLYVEFTHSQNFETFVRCHQHAFETLGGTARECWYDNLLTVVAEHDGRLVRFNPRFLAFAREYRFYPRACNPGAAWVNGKIEASIAYLRSSFWPLRSFSDLAGVNYQVWMLPGDLNFLVYWIWSESQTIRISVARFPVPRGEGFYSPGKFSFQIEGCRELSRLLPVLL